MLTAGTYNDFFPAGSSSESTAGTYNDLFPAGSSSESSKLKQSKRKRIESSSEDDELSKPPTRKPKRLTKKRIWTARDEVLLRVCRQHYGIIPKVVEALKLHPLFTKYAKTLDYQTVDERIQGLVRKTDLAQREVLPLLTSGLTNKIHPIFAKSQFLDTHDGRYPFLIPSLQLASLFLELPAFAKYNVVKADGELRRDTESGSVKTDFAGLETMKDAQGEPMKHKLARYPTAAQETYDDAMRDRNAQLLEELTPLVRFHFTALKEGTKGCASQVPDELKPVFGESAEAKRTTLIRISESVFSKLKTLYLRRKEGLPGIDGDLRIQVLDVALILFHELAHAHEKAQNSCTRPFCSSTSGSSETYYGDSPLAECGYEAEAAILHGSVLESRPHLNKSATGYEKDYLMFGVWPSQRTKDNYSNGRRLIGVCESSAVPLLDIVLHPHEKFASDLLTDEYWREKVPTFGQSPLQIPLLGYSKCSEGVTYRYDAKGQLMGKVRKEGRE